MEISGFRRKFPNPNRPLITTALIEQKVFMHFLVTGVHPQLVDTKIGKPLLKEAIEHFPEWSEKDVSRLFNF